MLAARGEAFFIGFPLIRESTKARFGRFETRAGPTHNGSGDDSQALGVGSTVFVVAVCTGQ